ncbi:phage tail tip lysozyme [Paraburkholderia sp. MM6662-R1]|uniref:phage tail tip lysozyme n=1 Tax=Paraburkholderia sp. MM6662-R1 TaxID=2991066 RepID=UPI003D24747F
MATIIDALLVTLKLDTSGYKAGADDAEAAGKRMVSTQNEVTKKITESSKKAADAQIAQVKKQEQAAKKLAEQYGKVKLELLDMAAGTFAATGLGKMIRRTVSGLSQLQTQSQLLGYSANELKKWQNVMTKLGGDPAEFNQFAARIAKFRSDVKLGRQDQADATLQAGMQMVGVSNNALMQGSFQDIFTQIAGSMKGKSNADIANLLGNTPALGFGSGMIQLVQSGAKGIADSYNNAAGANNQAAEDAKGLDKAYQDLKTKIGMSLQNFPGFDAAMKGATKGLEALGNFASEHPTGAAVGVAGAGTIGAIGTWLLGRSAASKFLRMFAGAGAEVGAAGAAGAAGVEAAAGAGGAAAAGGSALRFLGPVGAALWGMFHTENLNTGEDEQLKKIRAAERAAGGKWPGDTKQAAQVSKDAAGKLSDAASAQQTASKALVDAAKDFANAISTNASAAEMSSGGPVTSGNAKAAVAAFMRMGWTKEQASGIVANLNVESGLRPNIKGDNGAAYGVAQWHADRQGEFKRVFGKDIHNSTLDEQLQFVNYELTKGREQAAGRALRATTSAGEAGGIISSRYERPLNVAAEIEKRSSAASSLHASLDGASLAPMYAAATRSQAGGTTTTSTVETNIGTVNVYGSNTNDGRAVASDMRAEINQHGLMANSAIPVT